VAMPVHKSSIELFLRSLDDALVGCISIFIDLTELAQLRNVEGENNILYESQQQL
jgi:hypothetical protein